MGTCSYVLTGTQQGMNETFATTCHGAVMVLINCSSESFKNWNERVFFF